MVRKFFFLHDLVIRQVAQLVVIISLDEREENAFLDGMQLSFWCFFVCIFCEVIWR